MAPQLKEQQAGEEEGGERQDAELRTIMDKRRPSRADTTWNQHLNPSASESHAGAFDDEDGKSTDTMSAGWGSDTSLSSSDSQPLLRAAPQPASSLASAENVQRRVEEGREAGRSFFSSSKEAAPPSADNVLSFRRKASSSMSGGTNERNAKAASGLATRTGKRSDRWTPWNMLGGSPSRRLERRDSDADICLKDIENMSEENLEEGNNKQDDKRPEDEETIPLTAEKGGENNFKISTPKLNGVDNDKTAAVTNMQATPLKSTSNAAEPVILFGYDISTLPPALQFILCASGVFGFTIVYGYLQELLSVHILGRKYALFLATCQFAGYFFWSFVLAKMRSKPESAPACSRTGICDVPLGSYVALSLIRAVDLGLTNGAMQFLNYPAKTLIKSSRVVFTLLIGLVIGKKHYSVNDYVAVASLVCGLGIFLHADSRASAVFHPVGVAMLVVSLTCDGTVSNWSELIMRKHAVSQDEFNFYLYGIALTAMTFATFARGELISGMRFFFATHGTVPELESSSEEGTTTTTWSVTGKVVVMVFFSTTGIFGASCCGAITKRFGALAMSITSTARKATTLFLSFALFPTNNCTLEHVVGMLIFLGALVMKSIGKAKGATTFTTTDAAMEWHKPKTSVADKSNGHEVRTPQQELYELAPVSENNGNGPLGTTQLRGNTNTASNGGKADAFRVV